MLPLRARCPYVLYCRMVTYVTTRRPGRRWKARYSEQFLFAFATQQKTSGSGSGVNQKNASIESSRTSLGRRYGSGVRRRVSEIAEPGKVVGKAAPNAVCAAPLAARIVARVQGHILVLAQPQTREMRTRSMRKKRILDELPPELLSLVLSQLLPQDMMVQKCSRRWLSLIHI